MFNEDDFYILLFYIYSRIGFLDIVIFNKKKKIGLVFNFVCMIIIWFLKIKWNNNFSIGIKLKNISKKCLLFKFLDKFVCFLLIW